MNDNVLQFGQRPAAKNSVEAETGDSDFPQNNYVIVDIDGEEFYASGFLIFTPHHCAIMKDYGKGAVPELVVPLIRVKVAEMVADEDVEVA